MLASKVKIVLGIAVLLNAFPAATKAQDEAYPTKPVRMVVQYSPGGVPDLVGRIIAKSLSQKFNQNFYVENRLGANGVIATDNVASSDPDGYSLLVSSDGPIEIMPLLRTDHIDPQKALVPINISATTAFVLIASPKSNISTLEDVIRLARTKTLTIGSAGVGSQHHLAAELLKSRAKIDLVHVPYKGFGDAIHDLIAGRIDLLFGGVPVAAPFIASKNAIPIAVTSAKRSPRLPSVPTMVEKGFMGFEVEAWFGVMAPKGTPQPIIRRLSEAISQALASPEVVNQMDKIGVDIVNGDEKVFAQRIKMDTERWSELVKKIGLKL